MRKGQTKEMAAAERAAKQQSAVTASIPQQNAAQLISRADTSVSAKELEAASGLIESRRNEPTEPMHVVLARQSTNPDKIIETGTTITSHGILYHKSQPIKDALSNWKHKEWRAAAKLIKKKSGEEWPWRGLKIEFYDAYQAGERYVPWDKCDNFDAASGCLGHKV